MKNTATQTTPATLNVDSLRQSLNHALLHGGAWYIYLMPDGTCAALNPWSDSLQIASCEAALLFAAEASNLTRDDELLAASNASLRAEIADNLIDNYFLIALANELLADWWSEEEAAEDSTAPRWADRCIGTPSAGAALI